MVTPQAQIKINLPVALKDFVESKAAKFGMPVAGYIKHLILSDVKEDQYPTFEISKRSQKKLDEALADKKNAINADDLFAMLHES